MKTLKTLAAAALLFCGVAAAQAETAWPTEIPAACAEVVLKTINVGGYAAPFNGVVWSNNEPYFRVAEYGGFLPIGSFNTDPNIRGMGEETTGLAITNLIQVGETPAVRVEFYLPDTNASCTWIGGTGLREEHKVLWLKGPSPWDNPTITALIAPL